jgi:hypothetical protein
MDSIVANEFAENDLNWEQKWQSLMSSGHEMAQQQQWESAAVFYKEAFILAESYLCHACSAKHCGKPPLNIYLSSATELGKAIKENGYQCALIALVGNLKLQRNQVKCDSEYDMYCSTIEQLVL